MKIAFILPSLSNNGPIIVAKDIINTILKLPNNNFIFTVYYFDDKIELELNCKTVRIDFKDKYSFDQFDIVHSHGYRPDKYLHRNRKFINAKKVSTIHCDVFEDLKHSYNSIISIVYGRLWIQYLSKMDKIITLTNHHKLFYSKYINAGKIDIIYNGRELSSKQIDNSDKDFFTNLREANPEKTIVASFAGLSTIKGLDQIINVLPELENIIYVIIGDGSIKQQLIGLAHELKVSERCHFLGYREEASRYFKYIDIFAIPSYSEAFPLALIEATLHGKSCICSDIPVLKEIYNENEVTFFQIGNHGSLIKSFKVAIEKQVIKGKKSKIRAANFYTAKHMAVNYQKVYRSIVNNNE